MTDYKMLMDKAVEARKNSYCPYSEFRVGAALLCADGTIFTGCNVENSSYGAANCAERTAIFKAVSEGYREFTAIAIAGGKEGARITCYPCGICRQVMAEFCDLESFEIICEGENDTFVVNTLMELLPAGFGLQGVLLKDSE